jgi:hypothetical protein
MTEAVGPADAQQLVSRLEDEIVDVEAAARDEEDDSSEDTASAVPGVPEPPD